MFQFAVKGAIESHFSLNLNLLQGFITFQVMASPRIFYPLTRRIIFHHIFFLFLLNLCHLLMFMLDTR